MDQLPVALHSYIHTTLPRMHGWCTPAKAEHLAHTVLATHPTVCIEVGVYAGRSLFAIALALAHLGTGHILGIDPWSTSASVEGYDGENRDWWSKLDHDMIYKQCAEHRTLLGVAACTDLFVGRSDQAIPLLHIVRDTFAAGAPYVGLLHIDGNHSRERALYDVTQFVPLVEPGGIIYLDDLGWSSTSDAQVELRKLADQTGEVDGCGVFRRKA